MTGVRAAPARPPPRPARDARRAAPGGRGPRWPTPVRYDLALRADPATPVAGGHGARHVRQHRAGGPRPRLAARVGQRTGRLRAPGARVEVLAGGTHAATAAGCTAYRIDLDAPLALGAEAALSLAVHVVGPRQNDRFGRSGRALLLGNAVPVLAVEDTAGPRLVPYIAARRELLLAGGGLAAGAPRAGRRGGGGHGHGDRAAAAAARRRLAHRLARRPPRATSRSPSARSRPHRAGWRRRAAGAAAAHLGTGRGRR